MLRMQKKADEEADLRQSLCHSFESLAFSPTDPKKETRGFYRYLSESFVQTFLPKNVLHKKIQASSGRVSLPSKSMAVEEDTPTPLSTSWTMSTDACQSHCFQQTVRFYDLFQCKLCDHFICRKGYRCSKCGLYGHRKCLKKTLLKCGASLALKEGNKVFGSDLDQESDVIPEVLKKCINELERRGFANIKGVYRASGDKNMVRQLIQSFKLSPAAVDLSQVNYDDIASLVKLYLWELPEPLITANIHSHLIEIAKLFPIIDKDRKMLLIHDLIEAIYQIKLSNRVVLSFLMHHLKRISDHSEKTDMTAAILGINFSGTLMKTPDQVPWMGCSQIVAKSTAIEMIILFSDYIFGPAETYAAKCC